jgi:AcrR family transcriptional regulator
MSKARKKLVDAAGRLFAERGYVRVGINEIIATAGIAKATFYQHFPSKESLCAEWLGQERQRRESEYRRILEDPRTVGERLEAFYDQLLESLERDGYRSCPFAATAAVTDAGSLLRRVVEEARQAERDFWRAFASQHESSKKDAKHLGDAWMLLAAGAVVEARSLQSPWPVKKARRAALALGGLE